MRPPLSKQPLNNLVVYVVVGLILAGWPLPAAANGAMTIDAEGQLNYADTLFDQENYAAAIIEYRRFVYFFPDDPRVPNARYQIGLSLLNDQQFKRAIDAFQLVIDSFETSPFALQSYFRISEAYLIQKDFGAAILALENLLTTTPAQGIADQAHYHLGWIYIEMAAWHRAREQFNQISASNRMKFGSDQLLHELDQEKNIQYKNPRLAGVLSIVPGGGYAYTGRYQDAFMALVVNGILIWAAYEAFDNEMPALGAGITVVGFGFYAGNIYGGVSSAHKYNYNQTQNFIKRLRQNTKISLGVDPKGDVAFAIRYNF